jgi:hypothetical protein
MIVTIEREAAHVAAMGHRVALDAGGEAELKRRCLETLSHLNCPPDAVRFDRLWEPAPSAEPAPDPEPPPSLNSSAPTPAVAALPTVTPSTATPSPRSHKRR